MKRRRELEDERFYSIANEILEHETYKTLLNYVQHGKVSTYDHCVNVAKCAFRINSRLKLGIDEKAIIVVGLLHDFYLYDWHNHGDKRHGFNHPHIAMENAKKPLILRNRKQKPYAHTCGLLQLQIFQVPD